MVEIMQILAAQYRKREWLDEFRRDPNSFLKDWFEAYTRDKEVQD